MSQELEDLAARVARLEHRLALDAGWAASRDRDLSDLTVTFNAIQGTVQAVYLNLVDHSVKLDRLREGLDALNGLIQELIRRDDER